MAIQTITGIKAWFGGYDLPSSLNALSIENGVETQEVTTLKDSAIQRMPSLSNASIQLEGYFDPEHAEAALFNSISQQNTPISIAPQGENIGDLAYFFNAISGNYSTGAAVGEVHKFSLDAEVSDGNGLTRGSILANQSNVSADEDLTAINIGSVASTQKLIATLHVLSVSGTSPTLDINIESDSSNDFTGDETTRLSFDTMTSVGSQTKEINGAVTDNWFRSSHTVGGTTPSFTYVVVIGIK